MTYNECLSTFESLILPFVQENYTLYGYTIKPLDSHVGGRNLIFICDHKNENSKVLRISYLNDRKKEDYLAELEFVRYLYTNGASVSNVIDSKNGQLLETLKLDENIIYITMFEKANGMHLHENNYKYREGAPLSEYFYNCGKTLGKIHQLSKVYDAVHKRYHFQDKYNINYINELLPNCLLEVKLKIKIILESLENIEKTNQVYGMLHFDYSDGNYHIDFSNGNITVYDFDNCCFGWYMYDLAELFRHGEGWIAHEKDKNKQKEFYDFYFGEIIKGYRSETQLEEKILEELLLFVQANRIETLVDAFEVEKATGENYLDQEDLKELSEKIIGDILY